MVVEVYMPEVAADMTEADVVSWLAAPGDEIVQGDLLLEIETDKSTVEIEAPASGRLSEIRIPAGTSGVAVGEVLALIEASDAAGDSQPLPDPTSAVAPRASAAVPDTKETPESQPARPQGQDSGTGPLSPQRPITALARRLAERAGLDLQSVQGSGARGRILRADVDHQLGTAKTPSPTAEPMSSPTEAQSSAALTDARSALIRLGASCRLDPMLEVVARLEAASSKAPVSVEGGLIRSIAQALSSLPELNAATQGSHPEGTSTTRLILTRAQSPIGVAVERGEQLGLALIEELISPGEYDFGPVLEKGLGVLLGLESGVDRIEPTLQPGQTCALAMGQSKEVALSENQQITSAFCTEISLCADPDHITIEWALEFLGAVRKILDSPLHLAL